jgi:hypoxanthine phosphoribosyltransferase
MSQPTLDADNVTGAEERGWYWYTTPQATADDTSHSIKEIVKKAKQLSTLREKIATETTQPWLESELIRAKREFEEAMADYRKNVTEGPFTDLASL